MNNQAGIILRRTLEGTYQACHSGGASFGYTSSNWEQICCDHEDEFPQIHRCHEGTFNVLLHAPYPPPDEDHYRGMARRRGRSAGRYIDGNHISPRARVVEINGKTVTAWLYRGGHREIPLIELLCEKKLSSFLSLTAGQNVTIVVEEVPEGTPGMPDPPPDRPGRKVI